MKNFIKNVRFLFTRKPKWRIDVGQNMDSDAKTLFYKVKRWEPDYKFWESIADFDDHDQALAFVHDYNSFPHYFEEINK